MKVFFCLVALFIIAIKASGVDELGRDPSAITNPPSGGRCYGSQGEWGPLSGTVIAPRKFLAGSTNHQPAQVGDIFTYKGIQYVTTSMYIVTNGNQGLHGFTVWTVDRDIEGAEIAPIGAVTNFMGLPVTTFGRGMPSDTNANAQVTLAQVVTVTNVATDPFRFVGDMRLGGTNGMFTVARTGTNCSRFCVEGSTSADFASYTILSGEHVLPAGQETLEVPVPPMSNSNSGFYRIRGLDEFVTSTNQKPVGCRLASYDGRRRSATNIVCGIDDDLWFAYAAWGRAMTTPGDSFGGVAAEINDVWTIVAINEGSQFSFTKDGESLLASLVDMSGLTPAGYPNPLPTDQGPIPPKMWFKPLTPEMVAEIKAVHGIT